MPFLLTTKYNVLFFLHVDNKKHTISKRCSVTNSVMTHYEVFLFFLTICEFSVKKNKQEKEEEAQQHQFCAVPSIFQKQPRVICSISTRPLRAVLFFFVLKGP